MKNKTYSIKINNTMWLVLSHKKPIVKEEKEIIGLKYDKVIIDEYIKVIEINN